MKEIIPFNFAGNRVRVIKDEHGEPWFVAADVCKVLGFDRPHDALRMVDEDDKSLISQKDALYAGLQIGPRGVLTVNESGVSQIIFQSNKPEARAFKKWVTGTVLPSIRKHGGYLAGQENIKDDREFLAQAMQVAERIIEEKQKLIEEKQKSLEEKDQKL